MRLFLLPISTKRTLIYCKRLNITTTDKQSLLDKGTTKAANLWASWEKKESGWQRKVVDYGGQALKRIPYEEWGLKSIPPLSARRRKEELSGEEKVEVLFPPALIAKEKVTEVLRKLGTERQKLHKSRMIWSCVGMPITAPIALIPVIPNLPFFYLVFRAWSHWKALSGSKHIEFLLDKKLITTQPSQVLDKVYSTFKLPLDNASIASASDAAGNFETSPESMILHKSNGKQVAEALGIPELDVELERAMWQVERSLATKNEPRENEPRENRAEKEV